MRILVVEDQVSLSRMTETLLQRRGHEVWAARDGAEAIEATIRLQPDVVLMDIGLPDMSGHEVARVLRDKLGDATPILVALTGYGQQDDRRRSLEAGFDLHLVKPMDISIVRALLAQIGRKQWQAPLVMEPVGT
jgi:CheY-like chemotaxis protein